MRTPSVSLRCEPNDSNTSLRNRIAPAPQDPLRPLKLIEASFPGSGLDAFYPCFTQAVHALRHMLIWKGVYERPSQAPVLAPFAQTSFPEVRRDKLIPGIILGKREFAELAQQRPSPFAEADKALSNLLPPDLIAAIDRVAALGHNIVQDRAERTKRIKTIVSMLRPLRAALDSLKSDEARAISSEFNVAFSAACISAMQWPDVRLPLFMLTGFPVVGDIPDSMVYRLDEQPAETAFHLFTEQNIIKTNSMRDKLCHKATRPENRERIEACWQRTKEEIEEGLVQGPFSRAEMDKKMGRGLWRPLPRSAIFQKQKWRCIDDGKRSGHNKATSLHERIVCPRSDFPAMIAREFAKRAYVGSPLTSTGMEHGTDDLFAAYRRVPTSQPRYTCVMVWDSDNNDIVYCIVPGHNFGLTSAVLNFNRLPHFMISAARCLLGICAEHYFDDVDTAEPSFCLGSGQRAAVFFFNKGVCGFNFEDKKHVEMDLDNEFLGVVTDFDAWHDGIVKMDITKKRRISIKAIVAGINESQSLPSGLAGTLFGKSRFAISPCFSSVGTACLHPFMTRSYTARITAITPELRDSLEFIDFLMDHLRAFTLPTLPPAGDKVVIFTDASGKKRTPTRAPRGHLGFVCFHPIFGTWHSDCAMPPSMVTLFDKIKMRKTYIGHFEMIAAIVPFLTLPAEWFKHQDVELWIDNSQALGCFIKGYAGTFDCAKLVNLFKLAIARLQLRSIFIDYVPSESNISDIPSRINEPPKDGDAECWAIMGDFIQSVLPSLADEDGEWLSFVQIACSVWPELASSYSL